MTSVRPGATPSGFGEVVPFRSGLSSKDTYVVRIRSDDFPYFNGFQLRELRTDRIVNGWGESLTEAEFLAQAAGVCGLQERNERKGRGVMVPIVALMLIPLVGLVCLGLVAGSMTFLGRRATRSRSDRTTRAS